MNISKKLFIAPILGAALFTSCGSDSKQAQETEEKPLVKIETVTARDVPQSREFTATVEANVSNKIAPQSPVRIEDIFVEVGDHVKKGQQLVQMDNNNLKQLKMQLDNQKIEFQRIDELFKIGGASKSEWDTKKMNLDVLETSYNNLMENTMLVSPINGIITARNYDKGDMYSSGNPVLVVEQITPVKLLINVSETYFRNVKRGMEVDIKLDVYGDENFKGRVSLIYPTIDSSTRTFPVEITINNNDQRVRPGMFARVNVNFGTLNRVVVPDQAVIKQSGANDRFIYVLKNDGTVSYNKVELGRRMDDSYELISGVNSGDKVVIAGQSRLINGIAVEVE